jgi:hypothetical protein
MPEFLRYLAGIPPGDVSLLCPPPPPGQTANPSGYFDGASVGAAFTAAGVASAAVALLLVFACYLLTSTSLGPWFVKRWWIFAAITTVLAAVATAVTLLAWPTHAMAGTCETYPLPFAVTLPFGIVMMRALGGLFWGFAAFVVFSLVLTRTAGYMPMSRNGFFHNRGCPLPRWR